MNDPLITNIDINQLILSGSLETFKHFSLQTLFKFAILYVPNAIYKLPKANKYKKKQLTRRRKQSKKCSHGKWVQQQYNWAEVL